MRAEFQRGMMDAQARGSLIPRLSVPFRLRPSRDAALFALLTLVALGLRLWELDGRAMHYDESLHVHYSWRLATGEGYSHSPWMHGPFQVHLTAAIFKLFSDSDFTARLGYALFGSALVALPFFLRNYLGRTGAVVISVLLVLSPTMLYFSRFARNEIFMAFWAVALLVLMWRYLNEGKNRYLYMGSAVLALAFATKETAYILVGIFGLALFLMSLTDIVPWALGRLKLSQMSGAPAFLILIVTLTLPQWSALASIPMGVFGMELVSEGVGEVGLPILGPPFVSFPIVSLHAALSSLIIAAIVAASLGAVVFTRAGRRKANWLLPVAVLAALAYATIAFPVGMVSRDYLVSFGVLLGSLLLSAVIGLMWRWRVWLVCAGIFYIIWITLHTSVFGLFVQSHGYCPGEVGNFFGGICSKLGGVYTGSWQGLGYWLAQQDVARGGQPWYYHFLIGSVYEFLPLLLGVIGVVYYLRKGELLGLLLSFWAVLTLVAYTLAGEKMPWLLVNIALPFLLLAGKFLGDIMDGIRWRLVLRSSASALLVLPPLTLVAGMYLLQRYLDDGEMDSWQHWGIFGSIVVMAGASIFLVGRARPRVGMTLVTLGVAAPLLGFSAFTSFRASYSYDDSPVEMLAYAQGSADVARIAERLGNAVIRSSDGEQSVDVDYELWYPLNWYVRREQKEGTLKFHCYKDEKEDGYVDWCKPLEEPPSTRALLLLRSHAERDSSHLVEYQKSGPFRNLLWFPETYRRPGENRRDEGLWWVFPSGKQLGKDLQFAKDSISSRGVWEGALDYFLYRRLRSQWWDSTFFSYISTEALSSRPEDGGQGR